MPFRVKIDLTGQRFGRLTVLRDSGKRVSGHVVWVCRCKCGRKQVKVISSNLKNASTRSCGCLSKEQMRTLGRSRIKHGESHKSKLYITWTNLKRKCYNLNALNYDKYGGREIRVCKEWLSKQGYINFRAWALNHGYSQDLHDLVIDRLDHRRNYYGPENCLFLTKSESTKKRIQRKQRAMSHNVYYVN